MRILPLLIQAARLACAFVLSATSLAQAADTPTTTLTVRAYGTLAGNVGPIMQVLNGVLVGSTEVRSGEPTDYQFPVPALAPGAKLDVAYINDAIVSGVDRNLFVTQVSTSTTYILPNSSGVVIDRGTGAAAFDGVDVVTGQSAIPWNGALRMTWPQSNLTDHLTVRASGKLLNNVGPVMTVRVGGVIVGTVEVRAAEPIDVVFAVPAMSVGSRVDIAHTNYASISGGERSLDVHYLRSANTVLSATASENIFDLGVGLAAFDAANLLPPQSTLNANGALRGKWPATNMNDTLTVRASGRPAGGVSPLMEVRVDGIVLGSAEVRSATPTDFRFPALPMKPGNLVEVLFKNPGVVGSETRSLAATYAIAGKTYLLASGASLRGPWPEPNLTESLTIRAKGVLAASAGPMMQVLVDGIAVGSTEVRSTEFTDYPFSVPSMQPGRKVEVVFAKSANPNDTADRDLVVAYLISGKTYLLPNTPGITYDRGAGAAAFDNVDAIPGQNNLFWYGTLRGTWPQPNITSSVTVRARGSLAGNVGPVMQIRVDGVIVSSAEVRSGEATDYVMPVPPLRPGSLLDVIYANDANDANDAIVDGAGRNLEVAYIVAGSTFVQPTMPSVRYDLGTGEAAFDGNDSLPGQAVMTRSGALRFAWPNPNAIDTITVRASASLAANVGALMQLRVNGVIMGTVEVRSTTATDYVIAAPKLLPGSRIDVAFINDQVIGGQDRNLYVQYIKAQGATLVATASNVQFDSGAGETAFDGQNTSAANSAVTVNGSLRFTMPASASAVANSSARYDASRFLQQATFGPTSAEIDKLQTLSKSDWITQQMAIPATNDYTNYVQSAYDTNAAYRPKGSLYTPALVSQRFWATAAGSPDMLRKRVAFALHQILMVSQADSNLFDHARAYAAYLDTINRHAFGNYRTLLEEMALSPAMGIYLSHMRNRKEDPVTGRTPDENFAREVMQLFSIGLHELSIDGRPQLDSLGQPVETYTNDDVMAMAKVFTGWSWAFPDNQLTEPVFRWGTPDYTAANDLRIDTLRMKAYPGQHSTAEKRLFSGKPSAVVIPAGSTAQDSLRLALDTLFRHPNVGPFIGRQLIQHLVSSNPSPAYVARIATVFNNNGGGVRGDLAAVVRAVLLDPEAMSPPIGSIGKLREPVVRVTHWMRSLGANSGTGHYMMSQELGAVSQRALYAPSVFGHFRPGFVPPNTVFASTGVTVPELQIVNESTTAQWVNTAMSMAGNGLGWNGTGRDVAANIQPLADMAAAGQIEALIERLNLLLFAGRMSAALKQDLLDAMTSVGGNDAASQANRARVAIFLSLAAPEYLVQR